MLLCYTLYVCDYEFAFRKEREEEFFALNLGIKSQSLEASMEQFIQGEMLEGENAYLCEDCNEKVMSSCEFKTKILAICSLNCLVTERKCRENEVIRKLKEKP